MSIDATALPSELLVTPQPLIGFCGLDIYQNIVHKAVWEAFSANRKSDRAAVQFKILPPTYDFPVAKLKRQSYELYQPKGILKKNWMLKHLHVLPAVLVVFQELEWNDPLWSEKQSICVSTLQSLRNALQERNTRLCLVLIQKAVQMLPGEDVFASERAVSLSTACGLNSKFLYILPHTEHLLVYTLRLESAFLDLAQNYYAQMAKRIRTHRDQLTVSHTTLKIRHQFKLGFVAEMRQDHSTGLKHYSQAYAILDELRSNDSTYLEIKTIAGFLNYKICRLMFKLKVPRDAINHFITHIEKYENRIGFKDLIFEHYGWLSTQHSHFAELFCDAIKNGLPALQTQHPGIYYHKAAEYTMKRREAFLQSRASTSETTTPIGPPNNSMNLYTEYFGVRAGKAGEAISEQQLNMVVRDGEKSFNHSSAIINLLSQAMSQYKLYKCLRFRKKLAIDMADEYFKSGDYAKALTLYSLMLPDFRQDNWIALFSDVLLKTLRCAIYTASVTDFVPCSLEALSLKIHAEHSDRITVLENLWKVFRCVPPIPQNQFAPEIRDHWETALASMKSPLQIDMDKMYDIMEIYTSFEKPELKNDELVRIHVILRLLTDVPLKMRTLSIILTDSKSIFKIEALKYTSCKSLSELRDIIKSTTESGVVFKTITTTSTTTTTTIKAQMERPTYHNIESDLKLEPGLYYNLIFTTEAQQFPENTQLQVARIEMLMGTANLSALLVKRAIYARNPFRYYDRQRELDDNIEIYSNCYISATFHLVTQTNLSHQIMLVNEYFPIITTINNPYNVFLQNIGVNITVPASLRNKVFLTTEISSGRQKLHSHIQIDIGELSMQASNTISYFVFSLVEGELTLEQKISYTLDVTHYKTISTGMSVVTESILPTSVDSSPENIRTVIGDVVSMPAKGLSPVHIEFLADNCVRKTRDDILHIQCESEFQFTGQFYTLDKKPLKTIYRGENFLLRINAEVKCKNDLEILESYFICDHNLVQSTYNFKRKEYTNQYCCGEKLEDVIILRTDSTIDDWITVKEYDRNKSDTLIRSNMLGGKFLDDKSDNNQYKKNISSKAVTNINSSNSQLIEDQQQMNTTATNDDISIDTSVKTASPSSRMVFNKTVEAVQATSHCRGFFKSSFFTIDQSQSQTQQKQYKPQIFGVYCIKWRRCGSVADNESKFVINGLDIEVPPLNIYCAIEEKLFVKMPMAFKVVLKNPTTKVLHLIATLNISNTDNFICSGHKQLDVSVFAFGEKELVYNLYPLSVGWQNLPELVLEYNTQADPSKDESQNNLLSELIQRSVPKKVYVLPPLRQQNK